MSMLRMERLRVSHEVEPPVYPKGWSPEMGVYIWSAEHRAYWRRNAAGYALTQETAGIWPLHEAYRMTAHCGPEKRIRYLRAA
jgi:hypothetical protein